MMHQCTSIAGLGSSLGSTFGQAELDPPARSMAKLLVAHIASQLLDPGMLIGGHGLGGQLTADPVGRFGQDDSHVVFQRGQGCRAAAQPTPDDDQVGSDLAGRMGGSDSCRVPIGRGREERGEPGCTSFKKPSAIPGTIEPLGMIGVSVTMMKRDQVARSGRHDPRARVAELADAQDLGSCPARGEGSNPSSRSLETDEAPAEFWLTDDGPALR